MSMEGAPEAYRDPGLVKPDHVEVVADEVSPGNKAFEAWDAADAATLEAELEAMQASELESEPEPHTPEQAA